MASWPLGRSLTYGHIALRPDSHLCLCVGVAGLSIRGTWESRQRESKQIIAAQSNRWTFGRAAQAANLKIQLRHLSIFVCVCGGGGGDTQGQDVAGHSLVQLQLINNKLKHLSAHNRNYSTFRSNRCWQLYLLKQNTNKQNKSSTFSAILYSVYAR